MSTSAFEGWAVVELMGHRRIGGRVSEQEIAGTKMLRVDIPGDGPEDYATQFYGGSAIYCLTPTTEEMARAAAKASRPEPVTRWELPKPAAPSRAGLCHGFDESCVLAEGHRGECVDDIEDVDVCEGCKLRDTTVSYFASAEVYLCEDCAKADESQATPAVAPVVHDASSCGGSGECGHCAAADAHDHDLVKCPKCRGEGRVATSDDQEPWSMWSSLPPGSDAAVRLGLVAPMDCPKCAGTGKSVPAVAPTEPAPAETAVEAAPLTFCSRTIACSRQPGHDGACDLPF